MSHVVAEPAARPPVLTASSVRAYLEARFGGPIRVVGLSVLGQAVATDLKGYGYGTPVKVDYEQDGKRQSAVLETVSPGPFGHEHMSDRAQIVLSSYQTYNRLPRHVRSLDVGGFGRDGSLRSLGQVEEFFILNEYVSGEPYCRDLERLRDGGDLRDLDVERVDALCDYLVGIHRLEGPDPSLYARRVRELVGDHECIMGLLDSYPPVFEGITADRLERIEHACVRWRWRLKDLVHRLKQVHGDFHPWNILFQHGARFVALDRSRGEWGDPADDVACLAMNYVFFSLQRSGRLEGLLETLFLRFWWRYMQATRDEELHEVAAPYLAFRALVMASPIWYPRLAPDVREALFTFIESVLDAPRFDPARVNDYCGY